VEDKVFCAEFLAMDISRLHEKQIPLVLSSFAPQLLKRKIRQFDKFTPKKLLIWQVKNLLRKLKTITSD